MLKGLFLLYYKKLLPNPLTIELLFDTIGVRLKKGESMITLKLTKKEYEYLEQIFRINAGTEVDDFMSKLEQKKTFDLADKVQAKLDEAVQ